MNRRTQILAVAALAAVLFTALGLAYAAQVTAQGNSPAAQRLPQRWEYSAKFLCGTIGAQGAGIAQPDVNPGTYTTKVNIHNPNAQTVVLWKKVVVASPETANTQPITPTIRFRSTLTSDFAISVNCTEIKRLISASNPPPPIPPNTTFIEGYLVVDSVPLPGLTGLPQLDVDVVYTTSANPSPAGGTTSVNGIQVNHISGRVLPAGSWPF